MGIRTRDTAKEGFGTAAKEGFGNGGIQEKRIRDCRDIGKEKFGTAGIKQRRDLGLEEYKK